MNKITIPLDIIGVIIVNYMVNSNNETIITVENESKGTKCRICNKMIYHFYGYDKFILLRHLSILDKKTYIQIQPERYECPHCPGHPTTTKKSTWYHQRSQFTKAYEDYLLLQSINSTIKDTSIKEDVGYEAIMGVIKRYIDIKIDWKVLKVLEIIGIDEISLKKGHKDYVTIVTGITDGELKILAVLEDRKKSTVKAFLRSIPKRLKKTVTAICVDMNDGFINAAKEVFGKKRLVVDRFHVAKLYRKRLDVLRKKELKRLRDELSEEEYEKLKGSMWILRKKNDTLTEEEKVILKCLFNYSPLLEVAYNLCNDLTGIFEEDITREKARRKINLWKKRAKESNVNCFDPFIKTLDKYNNIILNYFINRQTSGFVEGFNNKIKVIKRRCYGIINKYHLFQRIFLDLEGYSIFT